jgi:hypothetical protein
MHAVDSFYLNAGCHAIKKAFCALLKVDFVRFCYLSFDIAFPKQKPYPTIAKPRFKSHVLSFEPADRKDIGVSWFGDPYVVSWYRGFGWQDLVVWASGSGFTLNPKARYGFMLNAKA